MRQFLLLPLRMMKVILFIKGYTKNRKQNQGTMSRLAMSLIKINQTTKRKAMCYLVNITNKL